MSTGQEGFGPTTIREDDTICQFLGCDIAAVLRSTPEGYDILGKAFINKSSEELEDGASQIWATKYRWSVPDFGETFTWTEEDAIYMEVDKVTLQQLTWV
jgi:hypothetical protein